MINKKQKAGSKYKKPKKFGTKLEVWKGLAKQTSGGITKDGLKYNAKGDIVYKKASNSAKKKSNLGGFIYNAKKTPGQFKKQPKKGTPEYYKLLQKTQDLLNYSSDSLTDLINNPTAAAAAGGSSYDTLTDLSSYESSTYESSTE